jgi:hypothetical protein
VIAFIRNGENDTAVLVLENIAVIALIFALHNNMAALDQAQFRRVVAAIVQGCNRVDPRAGGVHENPGLLSGGFAVLPDLQIPVIGPAIQPDTFRTGPDLGTVVCSIAGGERHKPGILDPAIAIGEPLFQAFLQRVAATVLEKIDAPGARQYVAATEMIVKKQSEAQQPGRPHAFVNRQDKAHRPDDMRGSAQQHFAFFQRLADKVEFIMFEIAQATVDQLGTGRRSMRGQIVALDQQDLQSPARCVARNSDAVYTATNDRQVVH